MAKFMLILGGVDPDKRSAGNPQIFAQYMAWIQPLRESGRLVATDKLHDQIGRRLAMRGGEVMDGPFIESKDAVGGYLIMTAGTLDEATEVAHACPILALQNGYVEVRQIEEMPSAAR